MAPSNCAMPPDQTSVGRPCASPRTISGDASGPTRSWLPPSIVSTQAEKSTSLTAPLSQTDAGRRDAAVRDAERVQVRERAHDLERDVGDNVVGQRHARQVRAEARQVLGDEPELPLGL